MRSLFCMILPRTQPRRPFETYRTDEQKKIYMERMGTWTWGHFWVKNIIPKQTDYQTRGYGCLFWSDWPRWVGLWEGLSIIPTTKGLLPVHDVDWGLTLRGSREAFVISMTLRNGGPLAPSEGLRTLCENGSWKFICRRWNDHMTSV